MDQERVRELIRVVLGCQDFEGKAELLGQVDHIEASGSTTWLHLAADRAAAPSPFPGNPVPGTCWAYDEAGRPIGTLVLWVEDGYLSDLELGWVTDVRPTALPDPKLVASSPS